MATVNGTEYDHIDIKQGSTTTKHMLKDATARGDIENLKSAFAKIATESENRFDPTDFTDNAAFDGQGNVVSGTGTWVSGIIKVPDGASHVFVSFLNSEGNKRVITTSNTRIAYYDTNGYLGVSASASFDLESGTKYIRIKIDNQYAKNQVMVEFNTTMSADFVPYSWNVIPSTIIIDKTLTRDSIPADAKTVGDLIDNMQDEVDGLFEKTAIVKRNYFNPDTVLDDYSIDASGNIVQTSGYCVSAPITIPSGVTDAVISYTGANGSQSMPSSFSRAGAYYYGDNDTKLTGKYGAHTIPEGAKYVRLTLNSTYATREAKRRIMYEFASAVSGFVPYTDIVNYNGTVEKTHFNLLKSILNDAPKIKLLGDSITQGVGGTGFEQDGELIFDGGGSNVWHVNTSGYCWANKFKEHVESISNATVKNWGCRSLSCMDTMVLGMLPTLIENDDDIIILMLGTNDRTDTRVPDTNADLMYQMNLKAICNYIVSQGKKLYMISPIPAIPAGDAAAGVHFDSKKVNLVCSAVAEQIGCEYFNLSRAMIDWVLSTGIQYSTLYSDTLHPNDKGYELMFYLICKGLGIPLDWNFSFVK